MQYIFFLKITNSKMQACQSREMTTRSTWRRTIKPSARKLNVISVSSRRIVKPSWTIIKGSSSIVIKLRYIITYVCIVWKDSWNTLEYVTRKWIFIVQSHFWNNIYVNNLDSLMSTIRIKHAENNTTEARGYKCHICCKECTYNNMFHIYLLFFSNFFLP